MVFRGWYDFGGGALADMGHYSLWSVFKFFNLDSPICVESRPSHVCSLNRSVAVTVKNDYSFPDACAIRFRFAAKGSRPALDLFWYDGSMKPPTPDELESERNSPPEGMMFVGDKGKILADFRGENPKIIPAQKMRDYFAAKNQSAPSPTQPDFGKAYHRTIDAWVAACKGGPATYGDFRQGGPISDAFNLAADFPSPGRSETDFRLYGDENYQRPGSQPSPDPRISRRLGNPKRLSIGGGRRERQADERLAGETACAAF